MIIGAPASDMVLEAAEVGFRTAIEKFNEVMTGYAQEIQRLNTQLEAARRDITILANQRDNLFDENTRLRRAGVQT